VWGIWWSAGEETFGRHPGGVRRPAPSAASAPPVGHLCRSERRQIPPIRTFGRASPTIGGRVASIVAQSGTIYHKRRRVPSRSRWLEASSGRTAAGLCQSTRATGRRRAPVSSDMVLMTPRTRRGRDRVVPLLSVCRSFWISLMHLVQFLRNSAPEHSTAVGVKFFPKKFFRLNCWASLPLIGRQRNTITGGSPGLGAAPRWIRDIPTRDPRAFGRRV
jgi:hypothetical protein